MSLPASPLKLQIIDRVVDVLKAIRTGASYHFTPASVERRYTHWKEVTRGPAYSVHFDSGGHLTDGLNHWKTEEFYLNVKGVILDNDDPSAAVVKCLRDVRYAIATDSCSTATGSLGQLCANVFIDEGADTDNGYLSLEGKGQFEQRIRIIISGNIEDL